MHAHTLSLPLSLFLSEYALTISLFLCIHSIHPHTISISLHSLYLSIYLSLYTHTHTLSLFLSLHTHTLPLSLSTHTHLLLRTHKLCISLHTLYLYLSLYKYTHSLSMSLHTYTVTLYLFVSSIKQNILSLCQGHPVLHKKTNIPKAIAKLKNLKCSRETGRQKRQSVCVCVCRDRECACREIERECVYVES